MIKYIYVSFLIFCYIPSAFSADLYLNDFSGQTGPAPSPAPYATTYLYLNNTPNDISQFSIRINFNKDILSAWSQSINDGIFKDWDYTLISRSSNGYITIEGWTLGPPVMAGASGLIAELTFKVEQNADSSVWLNNLQNDVQTFSTKNAIFTYISSPDNYPPIADAGFDQSVFKGITLDASGSTDQDSLITSWEWQLLHRSNSFYNRNISGKVVTLNDLESGFYDVILTVTDETGLSDTDSSLISISKTEVSLNLKKGWNLVSFLISENYDIYDFLYEYNSAIISVWVYRDSKWYVYDPNNQAFSDLHILFPGEGVWINCSNDIIIEY